MIPLTLYTTLGCHLCETLEGWLLRLANDSVRLERVEVAEQPGLVAEYGRRLPVLVDAGGAELDGGHEPERLAAWLAERDWLNVAAWNAAMQPADAQQASRPGAVMRRGRRYLDG